ncbi:tetratricopeptide repeat protein [Kordiimonas sp.]|uniref:tetratricopeptide repeat protein n=1 Tax=Kordiimonas sp. TaxID=1970157 RepID=UPI003A8D68A0
MKFTIRPAFIASVASIGMLAACGSAEEEAEQIDYASFDDAAVKQMVDEGEYQKALEVIKAQDEMEISDKTDFLVASDIYLSLMDGVAAEVAIEKAKDAGASEGEVALKLGRALLLQGKFEAAENILKNTEFEAEEKFSALLLRGDIAQQVGDDDGGRRFYLAAVEQNPDDFRGHLGLALQALNLGQLEDADKYAADAAALVEDDPILRYVQGTVARYQQRPEEAEQHLLKAIELHSGNMLAYFELINLYIEAGETEKAQGQIDSIYALAPNNPMAQYFTALMLAIEGKEQEAEYVLLRIGDLTRTFPPAARIYGHVAFTLGKYSSAQPYLERFLERAPGDRVTRIMLAETLSRRGQGAKALLYLEPLIGDENPDVEGLLQAAAAHGSMGRLGEAREYIERANKVARADDEMDQDLVQQLSQRLALSRYIDGDPAGAVAELEAMYADVEGDPESLVLLANMQMETGALDRARDTAERILKIEPDSVIGNNLLGAIRYRNRDVEGAVALYNKALAKNPEYQSALKNRGLAYMTSERYEEAKADFKKLLDLGAEDAQVHAMLGRVYLELGNGKDAAPHLKQATSIIPESAIITTDYAEALALSGLRSTAINQAKRAKLLAKGDANLTQYIDELVVRWQAEEAIAKSAEDAEREKRREELAKKREEMEKARQALIEDGSLKAKDEDEPDEEEDETPQL